MRNLLVLVVLVLAGPAVAQTPTPLPPIRQVSADIEPAPLPPAPPRTYAQAKALALSTGKPMVVWIGKAICPGCIAANEEEFVHHVSDKGFDLFKDDTLSVLMPSDGKLYFAYSVVWNEEGFDGHIPTVRKAIRAWDRGEVKPLTKQPAALPAVLPAFIPQPAPPVFTMPMLQPMTFQPAMSYRSMGYGSRMGYGRSMRRGGSCGPGG